MKTNVESRIANFQQTLVKFIERWNALKPSNDLLESSDMQAIDKAISTIKEKRIEFDELDKERQNVMLACTLTYISFYIFAILMTGLCIYIQYCSNKCNAQNVLYYLNLGCII